MLKLDVASNQWELIFLRKLRIKMQLLIFESTLVVNLSLNILLNIELSDEYFLGNDIKTYIIIPV